jgi:hypothetical protein
MLVACFLSFFFSCHIDGAQLDTIAELGKILGKWHLIEGTRYLCSGLGIVDFASGFVLSTDLRSEICIFNNYYDS